MRNRKDLYMAVCRMRAHAQEGRPLTQEMALDLGDLQKALRKPLAPGTAALFGGDKDAAEERK